MGHDFENLHDLDDLSDRELRRLVHTRLAEHQGLDVDEITVAVREGAVELSGRVGTEAERRIAEHVVTDVVGVRAVMNNLVVDELHRGLSPEAVDEHIADEDARAGLLLGDRPVPLSPEADHLDEDLESRLYGTTDVQKAIESGTAWIPPSTPTPEGLSGEDASPGDLSDDH